MAVAETTTKAPTKCRCAYITLLVLGVIFVIVGVVLLFVLAKLVHDQISEKIPLENGTQTFDAWVDPPVPVYMQFWFFDLVNKDDFVNGRSKPILKEIGPYTYREERKREDLSFSGDNDHISYKQPKSYTFCPDMSNGTENDTFINVNLPLVTIATMLRFKPHWIQRLIAPVLSAIDEELFSNYTVGGYLWGYEEPTLKSINRITEKYLHTKLVKNDTFGLFTGPTANGSDDGTYTVNTGRSNLSLYNQISDWQNKSSVPYWTTEYCRMINGTDGSGWHPFVQKTDTLYIFASDVCRSVYATYTREETVKGIPLYRFSPPDAVLQDHIHNPDNIGYCTPDCLKAGVLNVSSCREGAPVIVSQPHFYQGDQSYIDTFIGIKPDPSQHATVLDVEPNTGVVLNAAKKLQLNLYLRKLPSLRETRYFKNDIIFPVVWLNESALITDEAAAEFKQRILMPVQVSVIVPWVLIAVGILLFLIGLIILITLVISANKSQQDTDGSVGDDDVTRGLLNSADDHPTYNTTETT